MEKYFFFFEATDHFATADCLSDSSLSETNPELPITRAAKDNQARVLGSLEFINGAHSSSHPGFDHHL